MFFNANNKATTLIQANRGFNTSQKNIKKITSARSMGNPKPRKVIHHHFWGFRKGTKQDNRNKKVTTMWK